MKNFLHLFGLNSKNSIALTRLNAKDASSMAKKARDEKTTSELSLIEMDVDEAMKKIIDAASKGESGTYVELSSNDEILAKVFAREMRKLKYSVFIHSIGHLKKKNG